MADQDKERQVDNLLDSVLSQYASAEPRPGLETRVLARIAASRRDSEARASSLRWLIAGGGLVASALALLVVLLVFRTQQQPHFSPRVAQSDHAQQMPDQSKSAVEHSSSPKKTQVRNRKTIAVQAARQDAVLAERPAIFPTPVPLSQQERLMFSYMANTPRQEVVSQITTDDQKEAAAFWAQGEPLPGAQRPTLTR
ncbi:MAG TPA: hypothetical protein VJV96_20925 [Candidatus Angelobacter sp.]|jgi:cytoskeletal protein RodZ|nr:hypothetical protein [Candidatus Angelobacter sp.]